MDSVAVINRFHKVLLSWDYFELAEKADSNGGVFSNLRGVPATFTSLKEYKEVFEPLVLEECGAQILRGMEEGVVLTPQPAVVCSHEKKEDFIYARISLPPGVSSQYNDNDLVLLCKDNPEAEDVKTELHALGFCEAHEGGQSLRVKFYLAEEAQVGNGQRGIARVMAVRAGVETPNSCWWLLRLCNTSTISREWLALQRVHLSRLADLLLSARPRHRTAGGHDMLIPPGMRAAMEATCNPSQMGALQAGLDGTPLVLIQGPPGTGKTRTILNLLSVVLHAAKRGSLKLIAGGGAAPAAEGSGVSGGQALRAALWRAVSPWLDGRPDPRELVAPDEEGDPSNVFGLLAGQEPTRVAKAGAGPTAHVLVCAPSNSALDEIVSRIIKFGLMDDQGRAFAPSVVRIGVNPHHSVNAVALDTLVEARMADLGSGKAVNRAERDRLRLALVDECSIVCSTLAFAGSALLQRCSRRFDVVVVDEAAQCVEPSILIPLTNGCSQVYLVGDPVQLPATVLSPRAADLGYDTSLFKRLQQGGYPVTVLNVQYRMHPRISAFPSSQFYGGQLLDGPNVQRDTAQAWHQHAVFGALVFLDVACGREAVPPGGASLVNAAEAQLVLTYYCALAQRYPQISASPSVGVISPYKAQVKLLRETFSKALGQARSREVDVNTIDGFQGREKDITIFSCVRSGGRHKSIGFVADERRINVALTRARCSLVLVGNAAALSATDPNWAALVRFAATRGCLFRARRPFPDYLNAAVDGQETPVQLSQQELERLDSVVAAGSTAGAAAAAVEQDSAFEGDIDLEDVYGGDDGVQVAAASKRARLV